EEEIVAMEARGELDDLPDKGKPIKIWKTDVNPEWDLAFSRLKNAGVKPLWMELDEEIGKRSKELWAYLDAVEQNIRSLLERVKSARSVESAEPEGQPRPGLVERFRRWFRTDFREEKSAPPTITELMATR